MNTRPVAIAVASLLVACHAAPPPVYAPVQEVHLADAAFVLTAEPEGDAVPIALHATDAATDALLTAAVTAYEVERRVALENLANVDTPAFKRRVVTRTTCTVTGADGEAVRVPMVVCSTPVFTTGALCVTDRCLDVAIDGDGFFAVARPDGSTGYTRNGQLQVDAAGKLVDDEGCVLLPQVTIPNDTLEISIDPEGRVTGRTAGSPDVCTSFGQWTLHRFVNPAGLRPEGGCWRPTEASGQPITDTPGRGGLGTLKQGVLERSNVQAEAELIRLQLLEKRYRALTRVLASVGLIAP